MGQGACEKQMKFKIQSFLTQLHSNKYTQTKAKFNFSVEQSIILYAFFFAVFICVLKRGTQKKRSQFKMPIPPQKNKPLITQFLASAPQERCNVRDAAFLIPLSSPLIHQPLWLKPVGPRVSELDKKLYFSSSVIESISVREKNRMLGKMP